MKEAVLLVELKSQNCVEKYIAEEISMTIQITLLALY